MTSESFPESGDGPKRSRAAGAVKPGPAAPSLVFDVDMSFVSDDEIALLNRDYRHKNKPTDVLSFAQWEGDFASDMPLFQSPAGEALALGDLVISIETAQRQAAELGHSLSQEIEFLAAHGALHLLGYDHIRDSDRRAMWQWQEAITEGMRDEG